MTWAEHFLAPSLPDGASKGTSHWMGRAEAFLRFRDGEGSIRVGQSYRRDTWPFKFDLKKADGLSVGLIGTSGNGKGRSVLVRNAAQYEGSLLSIDVMGEQALASALVRAKDHPVLVLDPMGVCAAWRGDEPLGLEGSLNPLDAIHKHDPLVVDKIRSICNMLVEDEEKDQYWPPIVRRFAAGVYGVMVAAGEGSLPEILNIMDWDEEKREAWIRSVMCSFPWQNDLGAMIRDGGRAWTQAGSEKGRGIMANTVAKNLGMLASSSMRRVLKSGPIRFRDLKRGKASVYIVLPTGMIESHGAWLRILIETACDEFSSEKSMPKIPALFMLDEFANLGKLEKIKAAVTYARGDGYKVMWVIQDVGQLRDLYGEQWRTIMAQAGTLILLGIEDLETLEEVSKLIGDTERKPRYYWWKLLFNLLKKDRHFALETETVPLFRPEEVRAFTSLYGGKGLVRLSGCNWTRYCRENYDDVLEAGVDYTVHPKFSDGAIEPAFTQIEGPDQKVVETEEIKKLEAA